MGRNRYKKLGKKQKTHLEKENAHKEVLPEEENGKSEPFKDSLAETNEFPGTSKTEDETEEVGHDKSSSDNKEENNMETSKKEDVKKKGLARERKKRERKSEVQQMKEETPKDLEKLEVQRKEEKQQPDQQSTTNPYVEEFIKRSRELGGLGNSFASCGHYEMAVKCFTDAIKYNPTELKLIGNRSFCYERMQQYESALRDADLALCLDPKWIKGLFRKGKALYGLKRYYEASLIYKEVLQQRSWSVEAMLELEQAQMSHLMEMGFSQEQSSEALKTQESFKKAVESLLGSRNAGDSSDTDDPAVWEDVEEDVHGDDEEGAWITQQSNRSRRQRKIEPDALTRCMVDSLSLIPRSRKSAKSELYSVWVGLLAPAVTYTTLHELFSRAGTVHSIKMLLENCCAFVNYTRKEDCDIAIQCFNGMVVGGAPLVVRHPYKTHTDVDVSKAVATGTPSHIGKECFFWRTIGCSKPDCDYKHDPDHKNVDRDKVTSRLGNISHVGKQI